MFDIVQFGDIFRQPFDVSHGQLARAVRAEARASMKEVPVPVAA